MHKSHFLCCGSAQSLLRKWVLVVLRACQVWLGGAAAPGAGRSPGSGSVGGFKGREGRDFWSTHETCQATDLLLGLLDPLCSPVLALSHVDSWSGTAGLESTQLLAIVCNYHPLGLCDLGYHSGLSVWLEKRGRVMLLAEVREGWDLRVKRDSREISSVRWPSPVISCVLDSCLLFVHIACPSWQTRPQLHLLWCACSVVFFSHLKSPSANLGGMCCCLKRLGRPISVSPT